MEDWADEEESLVPVSEDEKKSSSNCDEQPHTSISKREVKEKMAERNGEMQEENGGSGAGSGIIDSIASKFGVTIPGHSTDEQRGKHEEDSGGIIHQLISSLPESLPMSGLSCLTDLLCKCLLTLVIYVFSFPNLGYFYDNIQTEKEKFLSEDEETSASINTGEEKKIMAKGNGKRQGNGDSNAGSGIIHSIASKFGVTVPILTTKEEENEEKEETEHKERENGGMIIYQLISILPDSLPKSGLSLMDFVTLC
jgi:hypothetical protein